MTEFHDRRLKPIAIAAEALRRNMQASFQHPIEDVRLEGIRRIGSPLDDPGIENVPSHATHYATYSMRMPHIEHHFPRTGITFAISATEAEPHAVMEGAWRPYLNADWNHYTGHWEPE